MATAAALALASAVAMAPAAGTASPAPGPGDADAGADASLASPQTSAAGVEVSTYGVTQVRPRQDSGRDAPVTVAVHAVQRVPGGTLAYFSVGFTAPDAEATVLSLSEIVGPDARYEGGDAIASTRIVVPEAGVALSTVPAPEPGPTGLARPFASDSGALPDEPGVMGTAFAVLPPLPEGVTVVDVQVGLGSVVPGVPVADGALEPAVEGDDVVPLGTGWPAVDLDAVAAVAEPELSVHELASVTESLDASRVTTETTEQVTIDVAADVLFAFDSAELSDEARATLDEVAGDISARAAPGTLRIVGHTDSNADDAYNDDLSLRRAQAVADVLGPALADADLEIVVEGRGEREPVASNDTEAGRQANRRVSVTFDTAEGSAP